MKQSRIKNFGPMLGIAFVFSFVVLGAASDAAANPKGIPQDLQKVFSWNLIGYPEGQLYTGGCGSGNRMFVSRNANHAHIEVVNGAFWDILDCNATGDNRGTLQTAHADVYYVYVRILGKPGGHIRICADTRSVHDEDVANQEEHECLLGIIDMTRGKGNEGDSKFSLKPKEMFDASLEDIIWSVDTNKDYRIAQFRVYKER